MHRQVYLRGEFTSLAHPLPLILFRYSQLFSAILRMKVLRDGECSRSLTPVHLYECCHAPHSNHILKCMQVNSSTLYSILSLYNQKKLVSLHFKCWISDSLLLNTGAREVPTGHAYKSKNIVFKYVFGKSECEVGCKLEVCVVLGWVCDLFCRRRHTVTIVIIVTGGFPVDHSLFIFLPLPFTICLFFLCVFHGLWLFFVCLKRRSTAITDFVILLWWKSFK